MRWIFHPVYVYIIALNYALFDPNWTERQFCAPMGFLIDPWKLVSLCISCSLCWGYHLYLSAYESSTHKEWWELKLTKLYRECLAAARALAGKVIITCTQLPLPSHWSRSPGSCPCSLPAPGHIRRSPYKCSHTSHRQSLLAPLRTELLKKQIQETAFFIAFVMLCTLTSYK